MYIFDQRFPKSSRDSLRHFHSVDRFENNRELFFENDDRVGEGVSEPDPDELESSRVETALQHRRSESMDRLTPHDRDRIFE